MFQLNFSTAAVRMCISDERKYKDINFVEGGGELEVGLLNKILYVVL